MIDPLSLLAGAAIYQVGIKHDGDKTHPAQIIIVPQGAAPSGQTTQAPSFYEERIDLTTAHTHLEKTIGPWDFVQASTDGTNLDGVSIKLNRQDAQAINLSSYDVIPVANCNKVYVTNDVRAGRTALTLTFSSPIPLGRYISGEPIGRDELAARLGSIVTYDRRGNVIWLDDMEAGLAHFEYGTTGSGGSVTAWTTWSHRGAGCAQLVPGTSLNNTAYLNKAFYYPVLSKLGAEFHFSLVASIFTMELRFTRYDGTLKHDGAVRYDAFYGVLSYLDSAGASQTIVSDLYIPILARRWMPIKLVINPSINKYVRVLFRGQEYSLDGVAMQSAADTSAPQLHVTITAILLGTGTNAAYVDDFIYTQNEP